MKRFVQKYQVEAGVALLLLIYLVTYIPMIDDTIGWCMTPYALSYKYGFISRGLVGSIIRIFIPNLTLKHIYLIVAFNTVMLCALTVFFINRILKYAGMGRDNALLFLIFLFIVNPGSIAFLFYWGNYGRFDLFMIMILMAGAMLMVKEKGLFLIPIFSLMGILIHQAYVFMYFPALIVLLLYLGYVRKNRYGKWIFWITGIVTCVAFCYMQFASGVKGYDYSSMMADINATTDLPGEFIEDDMMVRLEYFTSVFATIQHFVISPLKKNLFKILCVFIMLLPLLGIFKSIWKDFMSEQKSRLLWVIPWSGVIGMIPKFLMTNDYGRDFSALIISQFVLMFTLLMFGDSGMKKAFRNLSARISEKPVMYVAILVYMGSLGKFEAAQILDLSDKIYLFVGKLFGFE